MDRTFVHTNIAQTARIVDASQYPRKNPTPNPTYARSNLCPVHPTSRTSAPAEFVAEGFILLGDEEEAARWLAQAVHLGTSIHDAITRHNAVWRPWLDHPRMAPILEAMQELAHRNAQLPVAARALAMVEREQRAGLH